MLQQTGHCGLGLSPLLSRYMSMCFLYAPSVTDAGAFAKRQGWRPAGRSAWQTRDGVLILFLCFLEQLDAVAAGAIVYDAGLCREAKRLLKKRKALVR